MDDVQDNGLEYEQERAGGLGGVRIVE